MTTIEKKGNLRWLWLSIIVIAIDQVSKILITEHLVLGESIPLTSFLNSGLNIGLQYNTGASYSFLRNAGGWQRWMFVAIAIIVSIGILVWLARMPRRENWSAAAFALILGGAIGNL